MSMNGIENCKCKIVFVSMIKKMKKNFIEENNLNVSFKQSSSKSEKELFSKFPMVSSRLHNFYDNYLIAKDCL